jgi:hypothetical protein
MFCDEQILRPGVFSQRIPFGANERLRRKLVLGGDEGFAAKFMMKTLGHSVA